MNLDKIFNTILHLKDEGWNVEDELDELELFKNSKCENCKYSKPDFKHPKYLRCCNESKIMPYEDGAIYLHIDNDFCCNQWEAKS